MSVTTNPAVTGIQTGASFADPTGSIGLAAVNGSASTALRSDGAPALSQAILPSWTGTHIFTKAGGGTSSANLFSSVAPSMAWRETDAGVDNKLWDMLANGEQLLGRVLDDASSSAANWLTVDRTGLTVDSITFGGQLIVSTAVALASSIALTNGAAAALGTLTNAPAAGDPTKWIPINDNGTTRYIPCW